MSRSLNGRPVGLLAACSLVAWIAGCDREPPASIGFNTPISPTGSFRDPEQCRTDYCVYRRMLPAYGDFWVSILPQKIGTLTVTLSWPDPTNDLNLWLDLITVSPPRTGNRESYTISMQAYGYHTSDTISVFVSSSTRFPSPFILLISIT